MIESLASNNPASGGFIITRSLNTARLPFAFNDYAELTKFQEYLSDEYCISCNYFKSTKGHFGLCPDLPQRKPYDGAKKGSGCACWRMKSVYLRHNIEQKLPEIPRIRYVRAIVRPRIGIGRLRISIVQPHEYQKCLCCGVEKAVKHRIRHNNSRSVQIWRCKNCGKYYATSNPYSRSKQSQEIDDLIILLAREGKSSRNIQGCLSINHNCRLSPHAICSKIRLYAPEIDLTARKSQPCTEERRQKIRLSVKAYFEKTKARTALNITSLGLGD